MSTRRMKWSFQCSRRLPEQCTPAVHSYATRGEPGVAWKEGEARLSAKCHMGSEEISVLTCLRSHRLSWAWGHVACRTVSRRLIELAVVVSHGPDELEAKPRPHQADSRRPQIDQP